MFACVTKKPGLPAPAPSTLAMLEADFEEGLALTRSVCLTGVAASTAVGAYETKTSGAVVDVVIEALADTADLHTIEDVEEFNAELGADAFTEEELLGQAYVFVGVEGVAENGDLARPIALLEAGVGKGRLIKHGQTLV